jgi:pimeloyl-ACP methyl ester carboxylesterase
MARFLLVHGSCHGAWCWRDVIPALQALGHQANAIDLPSHGTDPTPLSEVTLPLYAEAILAAIEEPVILVGHSMGGYPITQAAAIAPEKVAGLVYLCAYMPIEGMGLGDMRKMSNEQPLLAAIRPSADRQSFSFDPAEVERLFYHDCPPGTLDYALAHLTQQAVKPQITPVEGLARAEALPRDYIVCSQDRAIPPSAQRDMAARVPEARRHVLAASHSPFFAMPDALAALLSEIAMP